MRAVRARAAARLDARAAPVVQRGASPVWFPPPPCDIPEVDGPLLAGGTLEDVRCPVCGWCGSLRGFTENLRESGICPACGAWTRVRGLAAVAGAAISSITGQPVADLSRVASIPGLRIYNTEARGAVHAMLSGSPGYVCSEYYGPSMASGDIGPGGVVHQDLRDLSLGSASVDLVLSTDVFEHVPDPYRAHGEVHRVLRDGGHHVFTVPYAEASPLDDVRARVRPDGSVEHLAEPMYHADPVRPTEDALVFTIFGLELVPNLARIGFTTTVYRLSDPRRGIVGQGNVVFDAMKTS